MTKKNNLKYYGMSRQYITCAMSRALHGPKLDAYFDEVLNS